MIDSITAGGKMDAPVPQRIFWASIEGAIAAALLWIGVTEAIQALQAGAISTGLPFTLILLLMCISLVMGLRTEIMGGVTSTAKMKPEKATKPAESPMGRHREVTGP